MYRLPNGINNQLLTKLCCITGNFSNCCYVMVQLSSSSQVKVEDVRVIR